jgi:hypothetical protein
VHGALMILNAQGSPRDRHVDIHDTTRTELPLCKAKRIVQPDYFSVGQSGGPEQLSGAGQSFVSGHEEDPTLFKAIQRA